MPKHEHHHHQQHHGDTLPKVIELEAEALQDLTDTVTEWVAATVATPPARVLDLGSGTGAGTFALLRRFPAARVTAVDSSQQMLARLVRRGAELGYSERLAVVRADLDEGLPGGDGVDLVWASSAVHHVSHPDQLFAQVASILSPDGWFMVVEADDVPWFLPHDIGIGQPGLERRCHDLLAEFRAAQAPNTGSDWAARLSAAGLIVQDSTVIEFEAPNPLPESARQYAHELFAMLYGAAQKRLEAEDIATLDVLLDNSDPRSLIRREDLVLHTTQKAWAAQRSHESQSREVTTMSDQEPSADYEALQEQRLAMLTGPAGSLSMIAMPAISRSPEAFENLPGTWSSPEGIDGVQVSATSDQDLQIDGRLLEDTVVIGPQTLLRFSETVTARVGQEVDGTWFLQVSDTHSPNLAAFAGLEAYDVDDHWVIDARYRSRAEAEAQTLAGRLGSDEQHQRNSPGDVEFTIDGQEYSLAAYATFAPDWVTINFTDQTSGGQTPSAGRILALPRPTDGPVVLDFNRAMLLPHESSPVYPCPVPPVGNHLPVAVTAGERAVLFNR